MTVSLLKLTLGPALVVASTLAGRRWGDRVAGILVALPVVAGPILFITYQLHGADFTAAAAGSSLLGLVSLAVFCVVFAHAGRRRQWLTTSLVAWAAVLLCDLALAGASPIPAGLSVVITAAATSVALALLPTPEAQLEPGPAPSLWIDLSSRAAVTAALVLVITTASGALGPTWTGLLAPFPTALTVVTAFVHAQRGPAATIRTVQGALVGLFGFAVFCVVLASTVQPLGPGAFLVALTAAVISQMIVTGLRRAARRLRPQRARGDNADRSCSSS